jgi:Ni/Co efflux regulator RcnB
MRSFIHFVLLAATAAAPLAAQGWQGDRVQAGREMRGDRGDVARGDYRAGQDQRDVTRDGRDQRDAYRDREAARDTRDGAYREDRRDARQDWRDNREDRRDDRRDWRDGRGRDDRGYANGRGYGYGRGDDRGRGWNNNWRNDRRYDWQGYRTSNRNLYRMPRYAGPRGYDRGYSRWSPGSRIQPYFYGESYWINDPFRYRLPPAYGGYRWVRYYNDVALVDIRSGLIADVIYSFFF